MKEREKQDTNIYMSTSEGKPVEPVTAIPFIKKGLAEDFSSPCHYYF